MAHVIETTAPPPSSKRDLAMVQIGRFLCVKRKRNKELEVRTSPYRRNRTRKDGVNLAKCHRKKGSTNVEINKKSQIEGLKLKPGKIGRNSTMINPN